MYNQTAACMRRINFSISAICLAVLLLFFPAHRTFGMEIEPFRIANLSPLAHSSGIPAETGSDVIKTGQLQFALTQDIASIYTSSSTVNEQLLFDGELYRWNLTIRKGITSRLELGAELPFLLHGGGFLDDFITDWHSFWGLPQGGRNQAPGNRLSYRYVKDGVTRLEADTASAGIGDISLLAAYQLHEKRTAEHHLTVALRSQLKLPTGSSQDLLGSGSTDLALLLTGAVNHGFEYGTVALFGSIGGLVRSTGDLLPRQQQHTVGFANTGIGLSPRDWISIKLQLNLSSPLYRDSSLAELSGSTVLLTTGGTVRLPRNYLLDIAIAEDLAVATAPDVTFHIRLSKPF